MKKATIIKSAFAIVAIFSFSFAQAQWKDSASYKQAVIQLYKQQTTGPKTYKYIPNAYSQYEQDTMFANAYNWKKETFDHPMILNYYHLSKGSPEAEAKIKYVEDTASKKEYAEIMNKAAQLYAAQNKGKSSGKHVAPGLSTSPNTSGKIQNKDKEIKEKVVKSWKF